MPAFVFDTITLLVTLSCVVLLCDCSVRGRDLNDIVTAPCSSLQPHISGMDVEQIYQAAGRLNSLDAGDGAKTLEGVSLMIAAVCSGAALQSGDFLSSMGVLLREGGDVASALRVYKTAARLQPLQAGHQYRIGNAFTALQRLLPALQHYHLATRLHPSFGDAYNNMGNVYNSLTQTSHAAAAFAWAAAANPNNPDYLCNLAGAMQRQDTSKALSLYKRVLALKPVFPEAHNNMANLHRDRGDLFEAIASYRSALAQRPNDVDIAANLLSQEMLVCDWEHFNDRLRTVQKGIRKQLKVQRAGSEVSVSLSPFYAGTFGLHPSLVLQIAAATSNRTRINVKDFVLQAPLVVINKGTQLHIAIVSSDLSDHIVGHGIASLLKIWRRWKQQQQQQQQHGSLAPLVTIVPLTADDGSEAGAACRRFADRVIEGHSGSAQDVAHAINQARVHVLLDLNGHTKGGRLEVMAMSPAPLQFLFHGYAGTSGSDFMQGIIVDRVVVPPEHSSDFSERLLYLPRSFFLAEDYTFHKSSNQKSSNSHVSEAQHATSSITRSRHLAVVDDGPVLACFNSLYKVDRGVFSLWCRVLRNVSSSVFPRLWLMGIPPHGKSRLEKESLLHGLQPGQLTVSMMFDRSEHLTIKAAADVVGDTLVYNGHSSSADALQAGVVTVTVASRAMACRVTASILISMGLEAFIGRNHEEYEILLVAAMSHYKALRTAAAAAASAAPHHHLASASSAWSLLRSRLLQAAGHVTGGEAGCRGGVFDRQTYARDLARMLRAAADVASSSSSAAAAASSRLSSHVIAALRPSISCHETVQFT